MTDEAESAKNAMIEERIVAVISKYLGRGLEEITAEKSIIDDLGAGSLDHLELMMAFEEEFSFEIDDETAEALLTVGDVFRFIKGKTKERASS